MATGAAAESESSGNASEATVSNSNEPTNGHLDPLTSSRLDRGVGFTMTGDPSKPDARDRIVVAHDLKSKQCRLRLEVEGASVLDGAWSIDEPDTPRRLQWEAWRSQPEADYAEWSFGAGEAELTRFLFRLRGRRLALLVQIERGHKPSSAMDLSLAERVRVRAHRRARGLVLRGPSGPPVHAWPLALPTSNYESERGSIRGEEGRLVLTQATGGHSPAVLPLLLSWHPKRDGLNPHWRVLTVSEGRKACPPGVAFAARVGWRGEPFGFVIYRSLAEPATRCFLGYQTKAQTLIGLFTPDGDVQPILAIGDE